MMQLLSIILIGGGIVVLFVGISRSQHDKNAALRELLDTQLENPTRSPQDISQMMERAGAFAERARCASG
jgi:hypothetical protein